MRTPCSGKGLFQPDSLGGAAARGRAGCVSGARGFTLAKTGPVSSPSSGARRPACQAVSVESQRLTG